MGYLKDNIVGYISRNKKWVIFLAVCLIVIFLSSMIASGIQSDGWKVEVTDLRDAENAGKITVTSYDSETQQPVTEEQDVEGKVVSGILFKPDTATAENPAPAVVFTHGYLNNREMQLQNAIELARRGFVVLAVDREGHGNYEYGENTTSGALMATSGLYDSAKYLYNLDYVDKDKIGISGHSMGGFTTAMTLMQDASVGIVSAGLIQSWSTFMGAGSDVSVGFLKSVDDEFFYTTNENGGTISREWLSTDTAKGYVGIAGSEGDVVNGGIYVNGVLTEVAGGEAAPGAFRAIYEVPGIHPQVHYSVDGAEAVINFFYTAFGTPEGRDYIEESNQTWWVKEMFSFIGMIALFACIFPLVSLLLTTPFFRSLAAKKEAKYAYAPAAAPAEAPAEAPVYDAAEAPAEAQVAYDEAPAEPAPEPVKAAPAAAAAVELPAIDEPKPLKGIWKNLTYWLGAVAIMLFSGFIIKDICTEYGDYVFPNTQLYPQDTTNWVAIWAVVVALFSLGVICFIWLANTVFYRIRYKENAAQYIENPFAAAKINGGFAAILKSFLLAMVVVFFLYLVTFINWSAWVVDFRIWTLAVKVFNVGDMLPTMVRYAVFFGIFFTVSALFNETYRVKNIPDWATTLINVFFNVFGVILVVAIQYGEFGATGVMWQPEMNLGYIVIIPMIGVLAVATVISRRMAAKTGNMWLGAFINTMLFTIITCANTAASFSYVMG